MLKLSSRVLIGFLVITVLIMSIGLSACSIDTDSKQDMTNSDEEGTFNKQYSNTQSTENEADNSNSDKNKDEDSSENAKESEEGNDKILDVSEWEYADVRGGAGPNNKEVHNLDLSDHGELIKTFWFNQKTRWPDSDNMPKDITPEEILTMSMNPGLGIRQLHEEGLTGKGVNVAIIDQPMFIDHPEYDGKIVKYNSFGVSDNTSSMHGPAVTSLLVGDQIGTAPDAKVYYAAVPSWKTDAKYYAEALDWIIEENEKLPDDEKIRVVSVSAAPSNLDRENALYKNGEMWDESVARAEENGILILDCTPHHGIISSCWFSDLEDLDNVTKLQPGYPGYEIPEDYKIDYSKVILVPTSPRTLAEVYTKGDFEYFYTGRGGQSWAIPYCSGVLALGWQINKDIDFEEMIEILFDTAYESDIYRFINPEEFIKGVKQFNR